jgi:hypothetical protein
VTTVHKAQGSQKRTIFFDPVLGTHQALTDRLINVALSRAKARLVVAFSKGDLGNPRLAQVRALMNFDASEKGAVPLGDVLRDQKHLKNTEKIKVSYKDKVFLLEGDSSGEKIVLRDCLTGKSNQFVKSVILERTEERREAPPKPVVSQVKAHGNDHVEHDGATSLGKFLRSKIDPKSIGTTKIRYKGHLYVFLGFDSSGDKVLLRECLGGPLRQFRLDVILALTVDEREKISPALGGD